jgi:BirA family transcriptional regulator, biotin operon repressor / biotin---[acetyl-CoA-carboxylase] ligase
MSAKARNAQSEKRRRRLLAMLADGKPHSGQALAKRLRISRAAVWKLVRVLRELGIDVLSEPRQGYRLTRAVDLLDSKAILEALRARTRESLERLDVLLNVDSTNRFVNELSQTDSGRAQVCVTEVQSAGRGRRGRNWIAPFGSSICISVGWRFAEPPPTFSALSLAVGVAAIRALERCGAHEIGLKWPNDLFWQGRKLGGILIEMRGESEGPACVVIGIGINMRMPAAVRLQLAEHQAVAIADVHEILRDRTPNRNEVIAALLDELVTMLAVFGERGFAPFIEQWRSLDVLDHSNVKVLTASDTTLGIARGVDDDGALLVDVQGELRRFVSGEVSVRREKGIRDRG